MLVLQLLVLVPFDRRLFSQYIIQMDDSNALLSEVRRLTRLVAVFGTEGKSQREQIRTLASAGFPPKDIAALIGTTANTVRVALTDIRKKGKSKKRRQR